MNVCSDVVIFWSRDNAYDNGRYLVKLVNRVTASSKVITGSLHLR